MYRKADVVAGLDYVLSYIVHCKSKNEFGLKEAVKECMSRYFKKTLSLSGASVIACLGKTASNAAYNEFGITQRTDIFGPIELDGIKHYFAFLPNDRPPRSLNETISSEDILKLTKNL